MSSLTLLELMCKVNELPEEIQSKILSYSVLPTPICLDALHGDCLDPWSCPYDHREIDDVDPLPRFADCFPNSNITSLNDIAYEEGYKSFFKNGVFCFRAARFPGFYPAGSTSLEDLAIACRSPIATRLLDFVDREEYEGFWSQSFDHAFPSAQKPSLMPRGTVDKYRHEIRHLALLCHDSEDPDLYWPLKVEWASLPKLKTLCISLPPLTPRTIWGPTPMDREKLEDLCQLLERLSDLKLESLVVYGLMDDMQQRYKDRLIKILKNAVVDGGEFQVKRTKVTNEAFW